MRLDRHLILIAVLFLLFQLVWLAHELQFIHIPLFGTSDTNQNTWVVGKIVSVHNNVRRRPLSEIVWNEGKEFENVKAYDALLTLKNSTMKVQLTNGAELNLSENTLVYLEPMKGDSKDQRIRIRFSHGSLRSKLNLDPSDFNSEEWVISPQPGAEFQLKSFENGKVEVELSKGSVSAEQNGKTFSFHEGEVVTLPNSPDKEDFEKKQLLESLAWKIGKDDYHRQYSHRFPTDVNLSWSGQGQKLVIYQSGKMVREQILGEDQQSAIVQIGEGAYELRIENTKGLSNWLRLDVWSAPVIHLMSPLPRDRYQIGESLKYIWLNPKGVQSYVWEMSQETDASALGSNLRQNISRETDLKESLVYTSDHLGRFLWKVLGKDKDGYLIPAPYTNPIFFVEKALDAPKLYKPELNNVELRAPAGEAKKKKQNGENEGKRSENENSKKEKKPKEKLKKNKKISAFSFLFSWIIEGPMALAEEGKSIREEGGGLIREEGRSIQEAVEFDRKKHFLRLSWTAVQKANHYVIEISETPDFRNPLVEKTILESHYFWDASGLKEKIFYWRVAGGSKKLMGRFSEVQEVNLQKLNSGTRFRGVAVVEKSLPNLQEKTVSAKEVIVKEALSEEPQILQEDEKVLGATIQIDGSQYTDSASTGYKYAGPAAKFRYQLDTNLQGNLRTGVSVTYQSNTWKNVDQDSIMQGKNYYESRFRLVSWLGKKRSPWVYSVGFSYQDIPERSGLETVRLSSSILMNVGVWYDWTKKYYFRGKMGFLLSAGSSSQEARVLYWGYRPLRKMGQYQLHWGPDLEVSSMRTNSGTSGFQYQFGILFGLTW